MINRQTNKQSFIFVSMVVTRAKVLNTVYKCIAQKYIYILYTYLNVIIKTRRLQLSLFEYSLWHSRQILQTISTTIPIDLCIIYFKTYLSSGDNNQEIFLNGRQFIFKWWTVCALFYSRMYSIFGCFEITGQKHLCTFILWRNLLIEWVGKAPNYLQCLCWPFPYFVLESLILNSI